MGPEKEKFLVEQARLNRQPIPDKIANAPTVKLGLGFYMDAFSKLSTCRAIGMTMGPIPWLAANEYALRFGLHEEEFEILWELIHRMDSAYLDWQAKQKPIKDKDPVKGKREPRIIHTGKR